MVTIKSPFPLILCCYLLVSFVFFPHGALSRKLLGEGGGNAPSKARVDKSKSQGAPSWVGQDSHRPPSSQVVSGQVSNNPTGPGWNCKTTTTNNGYSRSCSNSNYQSNNYQNSNYQYSSYQNSNYQSNYQYSTSP